MDVGARYKILRLYRRNDFRSDIMANIGLLDEDFSGENLNVCSEICTDKPCSKIFMPAYIKITDNRISSQITDNKMQRFLIYLFLQTLYMFQAVPPPIIRST